MPKYNDLPLEVRILSWRGRDQRIHEAFELPINQLQQARGLFAQVKEIEKKAGYSIVESAHCLSLLQQAMGLVIEAHRRCESPIVEFGMNLMRKG